MFTLCWPKWPLSCPYVDPMLAYVTPILPLCWPYVGLCYPYLALCWPYVGRSHPYLAPMLIAVTETTEVGTRSPQGHPKVTPGSPQAGAAAGAAALYNLRLPTEGKDTGCGRRPDLKADAWQPGAGRRGAMLAGLSWTYLGPMLPLCAPMLPVCWPMSALSWPKLALSCPMLALW